jgi:hypothetical protein
MTECPPPVLGEKAGRIMEGLRSWNCSNCGRSTAGVVAVDATDRCEYCTDSFKLTDDVTKQQVLGRLRARYHEAQKLVFSRKPYPNLESILGGMMNPGQTASYWADRTIELVALWLDDLSVEIDRLFPEEMKGEIGSSELSAYRTHRSLAQGLRDATETFVVAFRHSAGQVRPELPRRLSPTQLEIL